MTEKQMQVLRNFREDVKKLAGHRLEFKDILREMYTAFMQKHDYETANDVSDMLIKHGKVIE